MIIERKGDLLKAKVDIIAHQTNCHGKMGAGVAKQIKDKLLSEEGFDNYKVACDCFGSSLLGCIQTLKANDGRLVVNVFGEDFPTGKGLDTDYKALYAGLSHLEEIASRENLSVAIPGLMGCGLAGGDWNYVKNDIIAPIFEASPVRLEIVYFLEDDFTKYATFTTEPTAVIKTIQGLDFTREMVLLDPNTGETKSKEFLNDMDSLVKELCEENDVEYSEELFHEVYLRCSDLEVDDISVNIVACLDYIKDKGLDALINEMDDCNIWNYI